MNFQYMKKIEGKKALLDIAFGAAKNASESAADKNRKSDPIIVKRRAEQAKIDSAKKTLVRRLDQILEEFPKIDELPEFYKELLVNCVDIEEMNKSLNTIKWCRDKIALLHKIYNSQLSKAKDSSAITKARKGFYGRVCSLISRIDKNLTFLDDARKTLKQFPDVKEDSYTIAIAGYPNVGKSSLLCALTSSKAKIAEYAFTTTGLNIGYMDIKERPAQKRFEEGMDETEEDRLKRKKKKWDDRVQIIDVPGTFDRDFKTMNIIEKQAVLVIYHLSKTVLFIFDPSESCGYSIDDQLKLFSRLKKRFGDIFIVLLNKSDIAETEKVKKVRAELKKISEETKIIEISTVKKTNLDMLKQLLIKIAEEDTTKRENEKNENEKIRSAEKDVAERKMQEKKRDTAFDLTKKSIEEEF